MSHAEVVLAKLGWRGQSIYWENVYSLTYEFLKAAFQYTQGRSCDDLIDDIQRRPDRGPYVEHNARWISDMYGGSDAEERLREGSRAAGVSMLSIMAVDISGPLRKWHDGLITAEDWVPFAELMIAGVAVMWRDHSEFAGLLLSRDETVEGERNLRRDLSEGLARYGATSDEALIAALQPLYSEACQLIPVGERTWLADLAAKQVEGGKLSLNVLMPFIFMDPAPAVSSTAALRFAELAQLEDGDPLTGARYLLSHAPHAAEEFTRVGIYAGLLLLGDRRVVDRVGPCWRLLSFEGRKRLLDTRTGHLHAPLIEWMVEWLDDCEGAEFGLVAGSLARIPAFARSVAEDAPLPVWEVRRNFPSTDDRQSEVIEKWTIAEFAERIAPRLREIAARETGPRVMPDVLRSWDLA